MKADRSFVKSQQRVHRAAVERAERLRREDPLIQTYMDAIVENMRTDAQERPVTSRSKDE
jgi:hypothetical protein